MKKLSSTLAILVCGSWLYGAMASGSKTVAVAGTAETLVASSTKAKWVLIQADCDNLTNVLIDWDDAPEVGGIELDACETLKIEGVQPPGRTIAYIDLADIYLDVDTSAEGVHFQYDTCPECGN